MCIIDHCSSSIFIFNTSRGSIAEDNDRGWDLTEVVDTCSTPFAVAPFSDATMSTSSDASCYTVVFEDSSESPSVQELRSGLEKGSDEVKFDTLRRIIVSTINGNAQVY